VLAAIVREDLLGDPVYFTFHNAAGDLAPDHWFWDPARSGGILVEHGVHFFDLFAAIFGPGRVQTALVGRRVNRAEDRWQCLLLYHKQLFGDFLHAFAKAPPVEHTRAAVEFALGTVTLDGWIPTRLSLDGLATDTSRDRLAAVLPGAVVTPLEAPCPVPAVGREHTVTAHVSGGVDLGDKQAIYADACRDALADFLAWVRDRAHRPRVTAVDGRAALATALEATALARRTAAG